MSALVYVNYSESVNVFHTDYITVLILLYKYLCDLRRAFFNAIQDECN